MMRATNRFSPMSPCVEFHLFPFTQLPWWPPAVLISNCAPGRPPSQGQTHRLTHLNVILPALASLHQCNASASSQGRSLGRAWAFCTETVEIHEITEFIVPRPRWRGWCFARRKAAWCPGSERYDPTRAGGACSVISGISATSVLKANVEPAPAAHGYPRCMDGNIATKRAAISTSRSRILRMDPYRPRRSHLKPPNPNRAMAPAPPHRSGPTTP
jgi:hypothetical protein